MLTLTARTTVQELQQEPPALTQVLRSAGLYRDGDDPGNTIGQLCWNLGFNPGILLMYKENEALVLGAIEAQRDARQ